MVINNEGHFYYINIFMLVYHNAKMITLSFERDQELCRYNDDQPPKTQE